MRSSSNASEARLLLRTEESARHLGQIGRWRFEKLAFGTNRGSQEGSGAPRQHPPMYLGEGLIGGEGARGGSPRHPMKAMTKLGNKKRAKAKIGDIFRVTIAQGVWAHGQVIGQQQPRTFLVVIFRVTDRGEASIDDAIASGFDLAGIVFDAKLANGDWPILDTRPSVAMPRLWFVDGHPDPEGLRLTNFDRTVRRPCRPDEAEQHSRLHLS